MMEWLPVVLAVVALVVGGGSWLRGRGGDKPKS